MPSDREQNRCSEFRSLGNTSSLRKLFFESLSAVFVSSHPSFHRTVFFGAKVAFSSWRRYGLMSSLRHFYVFVSSYLVTLSPCYPVTLLPCYPVTLLPCYPVTLLPCYLVTLLPCYPVTLLPCYLVTLLPCYLVTLLPCYLVTLLTCYLVTLLPCYLVTLLPCSLVGTSCMGTYIIPTLPT